MPEHELKTWPQQFLALRAGVKRFELRQDDRGFEVGDLLHLREYDPVMQSYTGHELRARVTYLLRGPAFGGLAEGYVVMSVDPFPNTE